MRRILRISSLLLVVVLLGLFFSIRVMAADRVVSVYAPGDTVETLAEKLSAGCADEAAYVENVYRFVSSFLTYDTELCNAILAGEVKGHVQDSAEILAGTERKALCTGFSNLFADLINACDAFDCSAKTVTGDFFTGNAIIYHMWVEVELSSDCVIAGVAYAAGWASFDPTVAGTLAARGAGIKGYTPDPAHYTRL